MKTKVKNDIEVFSSIIAQHFKRHNTLLIVMMSFIALVTIAITIGWFYSPDEVPMSAEITFYAAQITMLLVTIASIIVLVLVRIDKIKELTLAILAHVYVAYLLAWATTVFCLDLSLGFSPLTYLLIISFVAGVFIIDPYFYIILTTLSLIPIAITIFKNKEIFFGGKFLGENLTLFTVFLLLTILICFRNHRVITNEFKIQNKLKDLSYVDELTGLLNERSYIDFTEELDKRIKNGEDVNFAVILMDLNNLKATNDKYGHRYGCSLVVRVGETLPTLFTSSKLFHVGGDEFVAIVMEEDLDNFDKVIENFDKTMLYSIVSYEGKELIFSVARGYHKKENGQNYKEALQIADTKMYENKKFLKEKYHMGGR